MKTWAVIVLVVALTFGLFGAQTFISFYALQQSQARWCATFALLTQHRPPKPTHPAANPSRVFAYRFYLDIRQLERQYHCG